MEYRRLNDPLLASFSRNVADKLAAHEVTCLDNALADDLAAMLAPLNTSFEANIDASIESMAVKQAATAARLSDRAAIIEVLSTVLTYLKATGGTPTDFEICLFDYPKTPVTVIPAAPTDLVAKGTSNGVNTLTFTGNNKPGNVTYEIWRRHGDTAEWGVIGLTRKQTYINMPVTPGEYYEYKVRAVAAKTMSAFSNTAVVYGAP